LLARARTALGDSIFDARLVSPDLRIDAIEEWYNFTLPFGGFLSRARSSIGRATDS
jgi:hypothetical protein